MSCIIATVKINSKKDLTIESKERKKNGIVIEASLYRENNINLVAVCRSIVPPIKCNSSWRI